MRKHSQLRSILLIALLTTIPCVSYGEPIPLTKGFIFIDQIDAGFTVMSASAPAAKLDLVGFWTTHVFPSRVDGFIDPSFSGVLRFDEGTDHEGDPLPNLQLGDRLLNIGGTMNVSVTAPLVPIPPPSDSSGSRVLQFSGVFQASFSGFSSEGEFLTLDITRAGSGDLFFGLRPPGPFGFRTASFAFAEPSAPIPEPTTILLLSAAGVAAIARQRSLRSR